MDAGVAARTTGESDLSRKFQFLELPTRKLRYIPLDDGSWKTCQGAF